MGKHRWPITITYTHVPMYHYVPTHLHTYMYLRACVPTYLRNLRTYVPAYLLYLSTCWHIFVFFLCFCIYLCSSLACTSRSQCQLVACDALPQKMRLETEAVQPVVFRVRGFLRDEDSGRTAETWVRQRNKEWIPEEKPSADRIDPVRLNFCRVHSLHQECDVIIAMGKANMSESPVVPMDIHDKDLDAKVFRTSTQARMNSSESPLLLC